MPLNPFLHQGLRETYGNVRIVHPGEKMIFNTPKDVVTGRRILEVVHSGEEYRLNCPVCKETRGRLFVNHRWGFDDVDAGTGRNLQLINCWNVGCALNKREPGVAYSIYKSVYGFKNVDQRRRGQQPIQLEEGIEPVKIGPVGPPGVLVPLRSMPINHDVLVYMRSRGLSPYELADRYNLSYCAEAADYCPLAEGRLIIPIYADGVTEMVGWQARFVGERRSWDRFPKYYTCPGMGKSRVLYNLPRARAYNLVIVVEGVTDAWVLGENSVATLGASVSRYQAELLVKYWGQDGLIVLLGDGDEAGAVGVDKTTKLLRNEVKRLVPLVLPPGRDPGSYSEDTLFDIVRSQCAARGHDIGDFIVGGANAQVAT